jgi:F-box-like
MNPTRVPVELLENIFGYIDDKNTLYNVAITCKLFNVLITPHLYQQVPMVDDDPRKIRDEPIIQTLNTRLTKLLEHLTPEKAQYVKLLALDPTTAGKELDIFSHFNNLETLVLLIPPDLPFRGFDPIKLHPQFLSVTNLAFNTFTELTSSYQKCSPTIFRGFIGPLPWRTQSKSFLRSMARLCYYM